MTWDHVTALELADGTLLEVGAVFGSGMPRPNSALADQLGCKQDELGYIVVEDDQRTSEQGVWAIGDVTHHRMFQMASAIASGVTAAVSVNRWRMEGH